MTKEELLDKLDAAETDEEIRTIGEQLIEDDPDSPYGKLAVWETMEYQDCVEKPLTCSKKRLMPSAE